MRSGCSDSRNSFVICLGQIIQKGGVGKGQRWPFGRSQRMGQRDIGRSTSERPGGLRPDSQVPSLSSPGQLWVCEEFPTWLLRREETPENRGSWHETSALALHGRKSAKQHFGSPLPAFSSLPSPLSPTGSPSWLWDSHSSLRVSQENEALALVWNHLDVWKVRSRKT